MMLSRVAIIVLIVLAAQNKPKRKYKLEEPYTWVYFVECEGFIKIGRATNPRLRVGGLQTGCPLPIRFLVAFEGREFLEKKCRILLRTVATGDEWFRGTDDLYAFISAVNKWWL